LVDRHTGEAHEVRDQVGLIAFVEMCPCYELKTEIANGPAAAPLAIGGYLCFECFLLEERGGVDK
jgi:hypothetical protein